MGPSVKTICIAVDPASVIDHDLNGTILEPSHCIPSPPPTPSVILYMLSSSLYSVVNPSTQRVILSSFLTTLCYQIKESHRDLLTDKRTDKIREQPYLIWLEYLLTFVQVI